MGYNAQAGSMSIIGEGIVKSEVLLSESGFIGFQDLSHQSLFYSTR